MYLATGLTEVGRPEAHDEEADLTLEWYSLAEAARMVFSGEIVNAIAVAGILAAFVNSQGFTELRDLAAEWVDRPKAFAARQNRP